MSNHKKSEVISFDIKFPGVDNTFFVKPEFLAACGNDTPWKAPLGMSIQDWYIEMVTRHKIANFLHNLKGPAVINHETAVKQFIINGKKILDEAMIQKMEHDAGFEDKFLDELNNKKK